MIHNVWSILCREVLTDQETNSMNYIHCIEESSTSVVPSLMFPINVGTLWEKDTTTEELFMVRIVLVYPSGIQKPLLQTKAIPFTEMRQRINFKLNELQIEEFGRHELRVEIESNENWHIVSRLPLVLKKLVKKQE